LAELEVADDDGSGWVGFGVPSGGVGDETKEGREKEVLEE
jgi:hypothetical protein